MYICNEKEFERLVACTPDLCAWGMGSDSLCRFDSVFFRANRHLLQNSYREFVICCTWLREKCISVKVVSEKSPSSRLLQQMAKNPHYVGHGAMIAAILYMGFPYRIDSHSSSIKVGISLNSPCFREFSADRQWVPGVSVHPGVLPDASSPPQPANRVKRGGAYSPAAGRTSRAPVSLPM